MTADATTSGGHDPDQNDLAAAVEAAVATAADELGRWDTIVAEGHLRLADARRLATSQQFDAGRRDDPFVSILSAAVGDLEQRLDETRRAASTFNIAFFGRTGAGKSTLLSTLGRLDGRLVSDGRSDFTVDVHPLDWRGCRLYDTPGINGWGRTRPRAELEETARAVVEIADVVLLCFDSQSQQAAEFAKVAEWVRAYRKPVIAVLNVRNPLWHHTLRVPSETHRAGLTRAVRQHADNIVGELGAIGLPDVPVVAVHSKRALFARAAEPFVGPAAKELRAERDAYGADYLDRASNLAALESLITGCVLEGAANLRLASLRDGFREELRAWTDRLGDLVDENIGRAETVEAVITATLNVLGYPDPERRAASFTDGKGVDLLEVLEEQRGQPFASPAIGRLEGHVKHLLRSHLYPQRVKSLRAAEQLIIDSFDEGRVISTDEVDSTVFDEAQIAGSLAVVAEVAADFISDNIDVARIRATVELSLIERPVSSVLGNAGIGRRHVGTALKASGLVGSTTGAVLGIVALTNWWNPAGWTAAAILGALGVGSAILTLFGKRSRKKSEALRAATRAKSVADARASVHRFFDQCEREQLQRIVKEAWGNAKTGQKALVVDALHTRTGCAMLASTAGWLRQQADNQDQVGSPAEIIRRAGDHVRERAPGGAPNLRTVLLGETWVGESGTDNPVSRLSPEEVSLLTVAAGTQAKLFGDFLSRRFARTSPRAAKAWIDDAAEVMGWSEAATEGLGLARSLIGEPPRVAVLGDYSSGKSSLIKRLLAEAGVETPRTLRVNAQPTTREQVKYSFGPLTLVDTPGFQSGDRNHDATALAAGEVAALTVVVLHVNLLIGDTGMLQRLLLGDEYRAGRARTTVFVIGRIDEVGVDPLVSPREFLARSKSKTQELIGILESLGMGAGAQPVLVVGADPFGLIGDQTPVRASDYAEANRVWDGVSALVAPLLYAEHDVVRSMSVSSAVDAARTCLLTAESHLRSEVDDLDKVRAVTVRAGRQLETASAELQLVTSSVEQRIVRAIGDHANEVIAEALGAGPDEVSTRAETLRTWYQDPRLVTAMTVLEPRLEQELTEWLRRQESEFEREARRVRFSTEPADSLPPAAHNEALQEGLGITLEVARHTAAVVKSAGSRDAVYTIVKAFGGKFKPWGAVKLGAKVAKVGAVLGVVAVGFDIADWVRSGRSEQNREKARQDAVDYVRDTMAEVVQGMLDGEDGPMATLAAWQSDLDQRTAQVEEIVRGQQDTIDVAHERLGALAELLAPGPDLADNPLMGAPNGRS